MSANLGSGSQVQYGVTPFGRVEDYIVQVCCLKQHYQTLSSYLESQSGNGVISEIYRLKAIRALCCAIELVENLVISLRIDYDNEASEASAAVESASGELFRFLLDNGSCLYTGTADGSPINSIDDPAFNYGIYLYSSCRCKKNRFQVKFVEVVLGSATNFRGVCPTTAINALNRACEDSCPVPTTTSPPPPTAPLPTTEPPFTTGPPTDPEMTTIPAEP
jgi:hypothetical protein